VGRDARSDGWKRWVERASSTVNCLSSSSVFFLAAASSCTSSSSPHMSAIALVATQPPTLLCETTLLLMVVFVEKVVFVDTRSVVVELFSANSSPALSPTAGVARCDSRPYTRLSSVVVQVGPRSPTDARCCFKCLGSEVSKILKAPKMQKPKTGKTKSTPRFPATTARVCTASHASRGKGTPHTHATMAANDVEEAVKRINSHKGVIGMLIINNDGIPIKTTLVGSQIGLHGSYGCHQLNVF
jgi:hypothetical protein